MSETTHTAAAMVGRGERILKGILAADESVQTMSSRLDKAGVAPTEDNRRAYREMLLSTPGLADGVSGVILCDETFRQRTARGQTFPEAAAEAGLLAGIKVDTGAKPLAGAPGEKITEWLDGLRDRLAEYAELGARFAKWRAVFTSDHRCPSPRAVRANAHALARYAALCQEAGLVPIVEPEVLMDGSHGIKRCGRVTASVLLAVFAELHSACVALEGMVLKPNMIVPGHASGKRAAPEEVAARTVAALRGSVPAAVAGIAFLSGGQAPAEATANLAALQRATAPWPLTFSFGRALVDPALAAWRGDPARLADGQQALAERVAANAETLRASDWAGMPASHAPALRGRNWAGMPSSRAPSSTPY
jgi:fructose-bisphosphate aldolase class I